MRELGRHFIFELYGCDPAVLDDQDALERAMLAGAQAAGAHICGRIFHRFEPCGVTGVVILSESHFSIHTWPEHGYAALDLFTCNAAAEPMRAFETLTAALKSGSSTVLEVKRGFFQR